MGRSLCGTRAGGRVGGRVGAPPPVGEPERRAEQWPWAGPRAEQGRHGPPPPAPPLHPQDVFYLLPSGNGTAAAAASAAECADRCAGNSTCDAWSWCPTDQAAGCPVPGYSCGQAFVAAAGTCYLSSDDGSADQTAFIKLDGLYITTVSGLRQFAAAPVPAPAA